MSQAIAALESAGCPRRFGDYAVSEASRLLREDFRDLFVRREMAVTGAHFARAEQALIDISDRCSQANWDGEGEAAVSASTLEEAKQLAFLLPQFLPFPEIDPDPDGSISFVWHRRRGYDLIVSVSGHRRLHYAALFGPGREFRGTEPLGASFPTRLMQLISQLFD